MSTPHAIRPQRTSPNPRRVLAGIDASIREMLRIRAAWLTAHAHATDAIGGPGSSLGGSGHSSDISDPTGRQALADDPAAQYLARMAKRMDSLPRELRPLADETTGWQMRRVVGEVARTPERPGTGDCKCCGHLCLGPKTHPDGIDDRIKAGFCEACYKQWMRDGQPERSSFIRDRRIFLGLEDAGEAA